MICQRLLLGKNALTYKTCKKFIYRPWNKARYFATWKSSAICCFRHVELHLYLEMRSSPLCCLLSGLSRSLRTTIFLRPKNIICRWRSIILAHIRASWLKRSDKCIEDFITTKPPSFYEDNIYKLPSKR